MMNTKRYHLIILMVMAAGFARGQERITSRELSDHNYFLASDELGGRRPGTGGADLAARYIRDDFRQSGLEMAGEDGFQYFQLITGARAGDDNKLDFGSGTAAEGKDFQPLSFSASSSAEGELAFCGYGITFSNDTLAWDEYKGIDVRGKWVMILKADPMTDHDRDPFIGFSSERSKAIRAIDQGAVGVLFVTGVAIEKEDTLGSMFYDKSPARSGIPVFEITRALADRMLSTSGKNVAGLEEQIRTTLKPASLITGVKVSGTARIELTEKRTANIVGVLRGTDPVLREQYIVIGAHYDHLGMGGPGSGSLVPDTLAVHNGADDNASGVAGILELAEFFTKHPTRRSLVFIAFSAEESGLVGSKEYIANPVDPAGKTVTMFNFDMIGRMDPDDRRIMIGGTGTSAEGEAILDSLMMGRSFEATYSPEGYGSSDHSSFYMKDIPVFFFTTGAHTDYHTPGDDPELIDYDSQEKVLLFAADVITAIANRDDALVFRESGPKGGGTSGRGYKVTLGILPDLTGRDNKGLGVDGIRPGGPAERGGMKKGDIITAINGQRVTNIYDYMFRLKEFGKGQMITVDVERNGAVRVLSLTL